MYFISISYLNLTFRFTTCVERLNFSKNELKRDVHFGSGGIYCLGLLSGNKFLYIVLVLHLQSALHNEREMFGGLWVLYRTLVLSRALLRLSAR